MLADAETMSGKLSSGPSARSHSSSTQAERRMPGGWDEEPAASLSPDQAYAYTYPTAQLPADVFAPAGPADPYGDPYAGPYAAPRPDPYAHEYADADSRRAVVQPGTGVQRAGWSLASKIIVGSSLLLFLAACAIVGVLLSDRYFPQARVI